MLQLVITLRGIHCKIENEMSDSLLPIWVALDNELGERNGPGACKICYWPKIVESYRAEAKNSREDKLRHN